MELPERQANLLAELDQIYDGEELLYSRSMRGATVQHPSRGGRLSAQQGDLLELRDLQLIAWRDGSDPSHAFIRVTAQGRAAIAELRERDDAMSSPIEPPPEARTMPFDWESEALPVLTAVMSAYSSVQPHRGVMQAAINAELGREQHDERTGLVLAKLEEAKFITGKLGADQVVGPLSCEPAPRALELLAGWPTSRADHALTLLVSRLEKRLEETTDEEEKGRIRRLLSSLREVGEGVMVSVLTDVITGG